MEFATPQDDFYVATGINTSNISTSIGVAALGSSTGPQPIIYKSSYSVDTPVSLVQIKGEMFIEEQPESHFILRHYQLSEDEIKQELDRALVDKLMKSNYIEFTKQTNPHDMLLTYRARIFAVPNTDIQTIRTVIK